MMEKGNLKVFLYFLKYYIYTTDNIDNSEFQITSWSIYSKSYVLYYAITFQYHEYLLYLLFILK